MSAQIKALPTTPVELVPTPGVGKQLAFFGAMIRANATAGAYTISEEPYISIQTDNNEVDVSNYFELAPMLSGGLESSVWAFHYVFAGSGDFDGVFLNQGGTAENEGYVLVGQSGVNFTDGNVANTMQVTVFYAVVDV